MKRNRVGNLVKNLNVFVKGLEAQTCDEPIIYYHSPIVGKYSGHTEYHYYPVAIWKSSHVLVPNSEFCFY